MESVRASCFASGLRQDVGFYGKLPSHGDFLVRRVLDAFLGAWDPWLQEGLAAVRQALGNRWLDVYLTSPVWRYVCAAGACGPDPVAGIMAPSVDKVGRYFPFTIVAGLPRDLSPVIAATLLDEFFDAAESLVVGTLEAEQVDFDQFDEAVLRLGDILARVNPSGGVTLAPAGAAILAGAGANSWCVPIVSPSELSSSLQQITASRLAELYTPVMLWWTGGSDIVPPSCLVTKGLPPAEQFVALMDASWDERRWNVVPAHVELSSSVSDDTLMGEPVPPRYRSAAATHAGVVREMNQDSYLERSDVGLWVVADGVGGQQDGDVASRMICDTVADFLPSASFEEMIEGVRQRLQAVNDHLLRARTRVVNPVVSASTVVTFVARGTRCAVLWAGDSRLYRWRRGKMVQLTRDHSVAELEGEIARNSSVITRALGGEQALTLDLFRDRVCAGDRFLLCSDGLTRVLRDSDIAEWIAADAIGVAAQGLVRETLDHGAPDNVTVLIVEAYTDSTQQ